MSRKDDSPKKPKRIRHEVRLVVPFEVKARSEADAAFTAMQWLLELLASAKEPEEITVYPPEPYRLDTDADPADGDPGEASSPEERISSIVEAT
uniref:Uncharacterized protein n=1 Tax=uncultured Armatimonadetes bacterium TaxID=157466 RepID=A0A6J4J3T6_9BACT|nr:hypothetical protein AVDCRST_MAG63-2762 [uncultured Armatimonadetes bacterium]